MASNIGHTQVHRGYIYAVLSAILFGSVATVAKASLSTISPLVLSATVYLVASTVLFPLTHKNKSSITRRDFAFVIIIAMLGAAFAPALYFHGLTNTTAANATLLSNGEIIFSILLAALFFRERIRAQEYPAIALIVVGLIIVTTNFEFSFPDISQWNILLVFATIFWAIDNNLSRIIAQRISAAKLAQTKSLIGSVLLFGAIFSFQIPIDFDVNDIPPILILGVLGFAFSLYFFLQGLRLVGTIKTILIFSLSSLIGLFFAWLFLQEAITMWQILASGLMLAGIFLLTKKTDHVKAFK